MASQKNVTCAPLLVPVPMGSLLKDSKEINLQVPPSFSFFFFSFSINVSVL